jgi:NHLM bacteriocin system ABC transporter peptidase/ATP-binding protein
MEAVECGAAALGMILGYYKKFIPLEELRSRCGVSRDGSKASKIVTAARYYGLEASGWRRTAADVLAGACPVIVFWNLNHFVVVEGSAGDKVFLNDPAVGPYTVSRQEFDEAYSGISLELKPGPDFTQGGNPPRLWPRLARRMQGLTGSIKLILALSVFLVVPAILTPSFTKIFIDDILVLGKDTWLRPLLLGMAITFLVQIGLSWLKQDILLRIQMRLALVQSASFCWHVLRLPTVFFAQRHTGDIADRVGANDRVAKLLAGDLGSAILGVFTVLFFLVIMVTYSLFLTAIVVGGTMLNVLVLRSVARMRRDAAIRLQTEYAKLFSTSVIGLRTMETLKATGAESDFFSKWAGYHARTLNTARKLGVVSGLTAVAPLLLSGLVGALVLCLGAIDVIESDKTIGSLVAFQALMIGFFAPIQQLVEVAGRMQEASADLARLDDVLQYPLDRRYRDAVPPDANSHNAAGRLTLQDVTFGYSPLDPPLIEGFSLDVEPGGWVALVGGSGSGKSTIGRLVSGLFEPWSGAVLVDGRALADWNVDDLAHTVAAVDQDIRMFRGSVRDNITLWDDTVSHARMVAATRDAALLDVVERMPGSFDRAIDEGGINLSGGQRQRVEIARALLGNPKVLVLDEATSALDTVTENEVMQSVRRRGCTCVVVAHRLSTIRDCDEIIVLEGGKIAERGRHEELLERGGPYARLIGEGAGA